MHNRLLHILSILFFVAFLNAQVVPGGPDAVRIDFRFNKTLSPTDSGIGLNGSFNNWAGGVYKMRQYEPNWWKVSLELTPITYEYKFVTYTDTVGQAGVTGYYTDPLNPRQGGPFDNSFITVKSPIIYYFLPKSGSITVNDKPNITANVSWANNRRLDLGQTIFKIDNNVIPNAGNYIDTNTRVFSYIPPLALSSSRHTAYLKVFTTNGDTAEMVTTFTISGIYSRAPYTFDVDVKSPNYIFTTKPTTQVFLKGQFNSNGLSEMSDNDSDGVFTLTETVTANEYSDYIVIANGIVYLNDPDNPNLSVSHRTSFIKRLTGTPRVADVSPASGTIFTSPLSEPLQIGFNIFRNDTSVFIDSSGVRLKLNGNPLAYTYYPVTGGIRVIATITNPPAGRNILTATIQDYHGNRAPDFNYVFGVYPAGSGFKSVDEENDDTGPGTYTYPSGVPAGSADIREVGLTANTTADSLILTVKMKTAVNPATRVGVYLLNAAPGSYAPAPNGENIKIPEWVGKGVYFVLADQTQSNFNGAKENRLFTDAATGVTIVPVTGLYSQGEFRVSLPLSVMENVMGTFRDTWYLGAYSYLKGATDIIKVNASLGGTDYPQNPNVYDVAMMKGFGSQARILNAYITENRTGGPRLTAVGSSGRGAEAVRASVVSSLLTAAPKLTLYAGGGDIINTDTVRIFGFADVAAGTLITLKRNGSDTTVTLPASKVFSVLTKLQEGNNLFTARMSYGAGRTAYSQTVTYKRIVDHAPVIRVRTTQAGNTITFNADSTYDPDRTVINYQWSADPGNPQSVSISGASTAAAQVTLPAAKGEYYFSVAATNTGNYTSKARVVALVTDTGTYVPNYDTWAPAWVDTQVIYSLFVRTFSDAGKFRNVTARMDELRDLGVNCIWLLPIHETTGDLGPDNPGYATVNYLTVMASYGTLQDFNDLVNAAHARGIKVILDHVIQHTSDLHPFLKDADKYKQYSPYYPFYYWDENNNYQYLFQWVTLPSLNYSQASTRNYLLRMAKYWVQNSGIDGYRSDVAWAVNDLRPEGPAYWQQWRKEIKQIKPDAFFLAEADAQYARYFDKKFDAAYDWTWITLLRSLVTGSGSINALDSIMKYYTQPGFPKNARPMKFLENQDEQRFIEANGIAAARLGAALMMTAPGIPHLYAGQEVGEMTYRGIIDWSDPHRLRPYYKNLIKMRKKNKALESGDYTRINNNNGQYMYSYLRRKGSNNVITVLNFSGNEQTCRINVPLNLLSFDSTATFYLNDEYGSVSYQVTGLQLKNYSVTLAGNGAAVFVLSNTPLTTVENETAGLPVRFNLQQNFPNPFNPATTIRYDLPVESRVRIGVYNALGEMVAELVNKDVPAGAHTAVFSKGSLASGVYFYKIEALPKKGGNMFSSVKKMIMLK